MTDQCIAEIDSGCLPIRVLLREYETLRFVELRLYRKASGSQELSPTNWAIGLDARAFSELKSTLEESDDAIQGWFGPREVNVIDKVRADMAAQSNASKNAARMAHQIDLRNSAWNGPAFFKSRSEGDRVVVELNTNHPVVQKISSGNEDSKVSARRMLGAIIAAYHDAKNRFIGSEHTATEGFLRTLEYEWGMILNAYARAWL